MLETLSFKFGDEVIFNEYKKIIANLTYDEVISGKPIPVINYTYDYKYTYNVWGESNGEKFFIGTAALLLNKNYVLILDFNYYIHLVNQERLNSEQISLPVLRNYPIFDKLYLLRKNIHEFSELAIKYVFEVDNFLESPFTFSDNCIELKEHISAITLKNRLPYNKTVFVVEGETYKDWKIIKEIKKCGVRYVLAECMRCHNEYEVLLYSVLKNDSNFCCNKCANGWNGQPKSEQDLLQEYLTNVLNPIVRIRDNNTCQKCGAINCELHVHHIFDKSTYLQLAKLDVNCITLCKTCHLVNKDYPNSFHSIYPSTKSNTLTDLENWLGFKYKYRDDLLKEYNKYYRSLEKQGLYEELLAQ